MRICATTWKTCLRKDDGTWTEYRYPEDRSPADRNPCSFRAETAAPMGMGTFLKLICPAQTAPPMISLRNFLKTACSPDKPGLHFLRVFNPSRGSNHAIYCDIIVFNTIYRIRGVIIWKYRSVWELKTGWESISGNTNTVIRMKPLNSGLDASAGGSAIAELIREKKVLEGGRNLYKSCGRSKCQNRHINGGGGI